MSRRAALVVGGVAVALLLAVVALQTGGWVGLVGGGEYDRTTVTVRDDNGTVLGTVTVRVADTQAKRYLGLSDTESLGPNEGMLFVHPYEERQHYVMRDMAFPLDIVFVDANGTVTQIRHASVPPEGTTENQLRRYSGRGKYVLEVNRGWTNATGVERGDRVVVPDEYG
ncbi:MAG: DUF192 domain-containing protein [Haloarculaceae archaeon]